MDNKIIGKNIKTLRLSKGETQDDLAKSLNVTCQAISGWERGTSSLSIDNLVAISKHFNTTVDHVLGNKLNKNYLFLAVDGGGTKTEFVIFDKQGKIYNRFLEGPSNPNDITIEKSIKLLENGIRKALKNHNSIQYAFLGIAGALTSNNKTIIQESLETSFPQLQIKVDGDVINIMNCSESADTCMILGTGVVCLAKDEKDKLIKVGGWGYLLDGYGSAYDMGRDVLRTVLHAYDAKIEKSFIVNLFHQEFPLETRESIIKNCYSKGKAYIANFSKILVDAYRLHDEKAINLIDEHIKYIAGQIKTMQDDYNKGKYIYFAGGLIRNCSDIIIPLLKKYVDFAYEIETYPQIIGAATCALKLAETKPNNFKENFMKNYKEL